MKSIILSSKLIIDKYGKVNFLTDEDLSNYINKLGLNILPLSIKKNQINTENLILAKGLILSGGGDIYKYKKNKINKLRDSIEIKLFNYFFKKNLPILLICRGFQLMIDMHKIKLFKQKNHVRKSHLLKLSNSKFLKHSKLSVNSYHNYSIKKLPVNYINVASTKDGSIEIAEHKSKKILGLMFHPERNMKSKELVLKSIKNFFK
jgi:putative glutamine amidotransferase